MATVNCPLVYAGGESGTVAAAYYLTWAETIATNPAVDGGLELGAILASPFTVSGQLMNLYTPDETRFVCQRGFLVFDTTAVSGEVTGATLHFTGVSQGGVLVGSSTTVELFEWTKTPENPPNPLAASDWAKFGATSLGSSAVTGADFDVVLNTSGLALVTLNGYTFLVVRMVDDYNAGPASWTPDTGDGFIVNTLSGISLDVTYVSAAPPSPVNPLDGGVVNYPSHNFRWSAVVGASDYTIQATNSSDVTFSSPIYSNTVSGTNDTVTGLSADSNYIWRVKADVSAYSNSFGFVTAGGPNEVDFVSETRIPKAFSAEAINLSFESDAIHNFASTALTLNFESKDATSS